MVIIKIEKKGKYVNIVSMTPMPALSDEAEAGAAFDAEMGRMADMAAVEAELEKQKGIPFKNIAELRKVIEG